MRRAGVLLAVVGLAGCGNSVSSGQGASAGSSGSGASGDMAGTAGQSSGGSSAGSSGSPSSGGSLGQPDMGGSGSGAADMQGNVVVDALRLSAAADACMPLSVALPFGAPGSPSDGRLSCWIAEAYTKACDCSKPGREALDAAALSAVKAQLRTLGNCDGAAAASCDSICACQLQQPPGTAIDKGSQLYACQNDATPPPDLHGFCGLDQTHVTADGMPEPIGDAALVAMCPSDMRRRVRFVGEGVPDLNAVGFLGCTVAAQQ